MTMMVKWFIPLLVVFALVAQVGAKSPTLQSLVVPGRSAGPIVLGMTIDKVEAAFGHPTKVDRDGRSQWYTWQYQAHRSIAVETVQHVVILISIAHDPRYRTREGLGDGDTVDQVEQMLGRPSSAVHLSGYVLLEYQSRGIAFVADASGHVTGIVVASPVADGSSHVKGIVVASQYKEIVAKLP